MGEKKNTKKNKERKVMEKEGKHKKPGGARQQKKKQEHGGFQKDMQIYTGGDSTITVKKESGVRL